MPKIRTRIAPSPTGDPHVGTAYIALFNKCFAEKNNGEFILRIEDTDLTRSTKASEQAILDSLRWLGLEWQEGPDKPGSCGPYRQSERKAIYKKYVEQLLDEGKAFRCYRTPEELDQIRSDRREQGISTALKAADLQLPEQEVARRHAAGAPFVVRMIVPDDDGVCVVQDMLRGSIELDWSMVDAQVLLKADGMPTYHLACVVDDHLMEISHVIRGEEWINSTPKHLLLYQYLGWEAPIFCHLPLLRNPDKSKLSKRKNPTSINYYKRAGFIPEALVNYLGRMGWSMPDEEEKFSLDQMTQHFDIQRVSLGGPIFDTDKLSWLNGRYLREDLTTEELAAALTEWLLNRNSLVKTLPSVQERMETFSDYMPLVSFLAQNQLTISEADFTDNKLDLETQKKVLQFFLWRVEGITDWQRDELFSTAKDLSHALDLKIRDFLQPLFIAVAGTLSTFSIMDGMELLGPELTRTRLRSALDTLGGVGKKVAKRFDKEYRTLQDQS